ncbi:MAG: hypothetical protein JWM25_920 [Thermoleophilia bacterium]|nr:hypothetical protein [Thermoleophilia bacterium]MCZ4496337.1 hypothetical protein [Thermoleophilia bacterium]
MALHDQHIDLRRVTAAVALLAAIVEGSDDAIIAQNAEGVIISWNPAAEQMFRYSEAEAIGQPVAMLVPEDHRGEERRVLDIILAGTSVQHYETERVRSDGERLEVSVTVSALREPDGTIVGASKIVRDITQARVAQRAQGQLAAIIESTDDAIISKDATGIVTSWNPAAQRLFGYSEAEMVGQPISRLVPPSLVGHDRNILAEILAGKKVDHYETQRLTRDGRVVDVSLTVSPLRDTDGTIIGASKVVRDVSERKLMEVRARHAAELTRANERLAAADRVKDQFLAMANHELRTPLTSIAGFTKTLLDPVHDFSEEQKREFLEIIDGQATRLTRMVDDMLTISRLELDKIDARAVDVDVVSVIESVLVERRLTDVEIEVSAPELHALVDPHHLQQILLNYLDNATKYGSGEISVHACTVGEGVVIDVRDQGGGIPDELEGRLFERFSRAEHVAQQQIPGTGLGLSIVRGLARAQGGDAWYEPNVPTGARFCVRLPRSRASVV